MLMGNLEIGDYNAVSLPLMQSGSFLPPSRYCRRYPCDLHWISNSSLLREAS